MNNSQPMVQELKNAIKGDVLFDEYSLGICGMAGSFGYEKKQDELSEKIGESILFPAVRAREENTTLVANGFSCRHQIAHFTGVKPKH